MHDTARPTTPSPRLSGAARWLALAAFAGYAIFLWWNASIQPGGADQSGYFNLARALTEGRLHVPARTLEGLPVSELPDFSYMPLGFRPTGDGLTLTPTYPVGLPAFFAAFAVPFGWTLGPHLVMVLHALAGVWLAYALCRQAGTSAATALLGSLLLATSPLYVQFSVQAMSDMPALVWCALVLWLAGLRSIRTALLAGAAMGVAVLIRPSNVLVLLPVAFALGTSWRRWVALGIGGAPFAVVSCLYNVAAYGRPLSTGYGDVSGLFSLQWVPETLVHYARWLPVVLSPLVVLVLLFPVCFKDHRRTFLVHGAWIAVLWGFYAFYYHTHELWWYLRFILPAFPSAIVAILLVGEKWLAHRARRTRNIVVAVAALGVAVNGYAWGKHFLVRFTGQGERIYLAAIQVARQDVPPDGIIFAMQASGALFYGTPHAILRWDTIEDSWPRILAAANRSHRPIYAMLFDFELPQAFGQNLPIATHWVKVRQDRNLTLWRYAEPALAR